MKHWLILLVTFVAAAGALALAGAIALGAPPHWAAAALAAAAVVILNVGAWLVARLRRRDDGTRPLRIADTLRGGRRRRRLNVEVRSPRTVPCERCGGGGFSGYGTGYDDVCDECGGRGEFPAPDVPRRRRWTLRRRMHIRARLLIGHVRSAARWVAGHIALLMGRTICEHCGSPFGVRHEPARTCYPDPAQNVGADLCRPCARDYHDHWDSMWSDFWSDRL